MQRRVFGYVLVRTLWCAAALIARPLRRPSPPRSVLRMSAAGVLVAPLACTLCLVGNLRLNQLLGAWWIGMRVLTADRRREPLVHVGNASQRRAHASGCARVRHGRRDVHSRSASCRIRLCLSNAQPGCPQRLSSQELRPWPTCSTRAAAPAAQPTRSLPGPSPAGAPKRSGRRHPGLAACRRGPCARAPRVVAGRSC